MSALLLWTKKETEALRVTSRQSRSWAEVVWPHALRTVSAILRCVFGCFRCSESVNTKRACFLAWAAHRIICCDPACSGAICYPCLGVHTLHLAGGPLLMPALHTVQRMGFALGLNQIAARVPHPAPIRLLFCRAPFPEGL